MTENKTKAIADLLKYCRNLSMHLSIRNLQNQRSFNWARTPSLLFICLVVFCIQTKTDLNTPHPHFRLAIISLLRYFFSFLYFTLSTLSTLFDYIPLILPRSWYNVCPNPASSTKPNSFSPLANHCFPD